MIHCPGLDGLDGAFRLRGALVLLWLDEWINPPSLLANFLAGFLSLLAGRLDRWIMRGSRRGAQNDCLSRDGARSHALQAGCLNKYLYLDVYLRCTQSMRPLIDLIYKC